MMEDHEFCDSCPGCRPAILNPRTNQLLDKHSPEMQRVNEIWDNDTTYAQRRAFIEVTLKNSRIKMDLKLAEQVVDLIKEVLR